MKKIILIICALCVMQNVADCALPNSEKISNIEMELFGYEYSTESETSRMDRIENQLYGKTSSGSIDSKISKVNSDLGITDKEKVFTTKDNDSSKIASDYEKESPEVEYPIVDELEKKVFGSSYSGENIYSRVDRLEKKIYNKVSDNDLNSRVNKLRISIFDNLSPSRVADASTANLYRDDYYSTTQNGINSLGSDRAYNYSSPSTTNQSYEATELSAVEKLVLKRTYPREDVSTRLSRLEKKIFKRNFLNESSVNRLDRISAAATAKQSSQMYDNNKLMRNLSTGVQIGGFLLMILAMIL